MKSFTGLGSFFQSLSQNNSTTNATLGNTLIGDAYRYLNEKFYFNESSTTIKGVSQQQFYNLPYDYSQLKSNTITVGTLRWTVREVLSRPDWDGINVFPYYSDIPENYYIYGQKIGIWPIPSTGSTTATYTGLTGTLNAGDTVTAGATTGIILSFSTTSMIIAMNQYATLPTGSFTTSGSASGTISATTVTAGNTITFNYKKRVLDLSLADYTTGTVSMTNGSYTLTGSGTSWLTNYLPAAGSVLLQNLWVQITPPNGDGTWYQISSIESNTSLTLVNTYQGTSSSGANYVIGQMPIILEDFHDLIVYRALVVYYSSINKDMDKAKQFKDLYDEGVGMMQEYSGKKSTNVNLRGAINTLNPNVYQSSIGGNP